MKLLILGGGQLARMLALDAAPLGIECQVVDTHAESCAAQVAPFSCRDWSVPGALDDLLAWADVVTYESESIPVALLESIASQVALYPPVRAQRLCGDRLVEKRTLTGLGIPVAAHREVNSFAELEQAVAELGGTSILKWRTQGYDGKGQWRLNEQSDLAAIWRAAEARPSIVEAMVPFSREVSLVAARGRSGEVVCYPLTENSHRQGILHSSRPLMSDPLQAQAEQYAHHAEVGIAEGGVGKAEIPQHRQQEGDQQAIAGFDDSDVVQACYPALTSVQIPYRKMGDMAAEMILRKLVGEVLQDSTQTI